jgi:hypothetical protein
MTLNSRSATAADAHISGQSLELWGAEAHDGRARIAIAYLRSKEVMPAPRRPRQDAHLPAARGGAAIGSSRNPCPPATGVVPLRNPEKHDTRYPNHG